MTNDVLALIQQRMGFEIERVMERTSRNLRESTEKLAVQGILHSGMALKEHARISAEGVKERGEALWRIIKDALDAAEPTYTEELAVQLRRIVENSFPDPPTHEYLPLEEHARRLGFEQAITGMRHDVDVVNNQTRRDVASRLKHELVRLGRRTKKDEATRAMLEGGAGGVHSSNRSLWAWISSHPLGVTVAGGVVVSVLYLFVLEPFRDATMYDSKPSAREVVREIVSSAQEIKTQRPQLTLEQALETAKMESEEETRRFIENATAQWNKELLDRARTLLKDGLAHDIDTALAKARTANDAEHAAFVATMRRGSEQQLVQRASELLSEGKATTVDEALSLAREERDREVQEFFRSIRNATEQEILERAQGLISGE